jgi:FlgD Ig-like domain
MEEIVRRTGTPLGQCPIARLFFLSLLCLGPSSSAAQPFLFEGNGNYYELIEVQTTWADAKASAAARSFLGIDGHLATITSGIENEFISSTFATGESQFFAWIAGNEPNDDGVWIWGAGPEDGVQFSQGGIATPPYNYVNWGGIEPNDFAVGEDLAAINIGATFAGILPGKWGDSPNPNPADPIHGYVVEYEAATSVGAGADANGAGLAIQAILPSPIIETAAVQFVIPRRSEMELVVFDSSGRRVRTLMSGAISEGVQTAAWDGRDEGGVRVASGVYFFRLLAGEASATCKAILAR